MEQSQSNVQTIGNTAPIFPIYYPHIFLGLRIFQNMGEKGSPHMGVQV